MPGTAWWCQLAPPSVVQAALMPTAPPSGKRESCAAAIATSGCAGSTATSGSTTVSVSEPFREGTSCRVTTPECCTVSPGAAQAAVAGRTAAPRPAARRTAGRRRTMAVPDPAAMVPGLSQPVGTGGSGWSALLQRRVEADLYAGERLADRAAGLRVL